MIRVTQLFRKQHPSFFSIEKVFSLLAPCLKEVVDLRQLHMPDYTSGISRVIKNILFVRKNRSGNLYHITGDIHYVALGLPGNKTILTIHDCVFLYNASGLKRAVLKWLLLNMPAKRVAVITTISEFTRQEIIKHSGCDPQKVVVIPNSVNHFIYHRRRNFNDANPVLLFIGTTANKNLTRVIAALQGLRCHLKVIGRITTDDLQLLERNQIDFSSFVNLSESELADAYADCDVLLFPSTFEGFGLPILEGQKAGRVVITSNREPMKSVAGNGAYLINPYDPHDIRRGIETVITDKNKRELLIENGLRNVVSYEPKRIAAAYLSVYEKLFQLQVSQTTNK